MAPAAARRAHLVQRNHFQGLQGNPDACNPGRGSACDVSTNRAGGDARLVYALSVQPTAAMSPRTGGAPGGTPPGPFFPPISLGRNGGARRAGAPPGAPRCENVEPLIRHLLCKCHLPPKGRKASGG